MPLGGARVDVGDRVARIPRCRSRRSGSREQHAGERVGQAEGGDGPDRAVLGGAGNSYRMQSGYFVFVPPQVHGSRFTDWYFLPSEPT